ncbi:hypothetical protein MCOR07_010689 [Pyricularia oryzae]|uniref:Glucose-6-phosphate 1-epimerase n=1 Tax=Pyricularia grisea TaxID=148305 RepID=A0ABQ8N4R5_PYRGI|nr:hypothetical protein MCOR01_005205 [Pyricularia oryzae]KAI6290724.1 hypothetical protein MCOR33_011096 [Pyricularia grisea]KAI6282589.1 hypothetical protein MCOR26_002792 [Pyricularia oryzae]KAI6337797.1 hypothetical protein MCOR28_008336 [Pyricularia oryzae]KAI6351859.1 hypothetical protein MCOR32_011518 [Pyricularia oryzae]
MVDRPNKPSALASTPGLPPQAQVSITHDKSRVEAVLPTGESVEVLLYGASVLSWKKNGQEKLWLSEGAKLDGSKAVRGGIPLVFPVFGTAPDHEATSALPQHGFARTSTWEFLGKSTSESAGEGDGAPRSMADLSVKLDFGLSSANLDEKTRALWPHPFGLLYSVTLDRDALTTSLIVTNEGDKPIEVQVLLHTYLRVKDINNVTIEGLENASYIDKVDNASTKTQDTAPLAINGETDRIYTPVGGPRAPVTVLEGGQKTFEVVRDGNLDDVVVWNPWTEKANSIGDFEPKVGFNNMLCIEPGAVRAWQTLEAGDALEGAQTIRAW